MSVGDPPDFVAAREHVLRTVVTFARTLRSNGANVPANASLSATEALVEVGLDDRERVRAATRASLVSDPRDVEVFESHFPKFWYQLRTGLEATATADDVGDRAGSSSGMFGSDADEAAETTAVSVEEASESGDSGDGETELRSMRVADREVDPESVLEADDQTRTTTYSGAGEGASVDDEWNTPLDRAALRRFERALATLPGRRWSPAGDGRGIDAQRVLRESVATGGVALSLPSRDRKPTALRATVLVDVSRSVLDTIDRGFLLAFLDTLVEDSRSVRVFFFDTDISEMTSVFERGTGDPAAALARAEIEWGGGTRSGAALSTFRERWPDGVDHRSVALVISDGLDVGEIKDLEDGMVWLSRRSGPILWLNPLAASPAYEPTCRGMEAALPYVDGLFAFAGSPDLDEIARQLERHGPADAVGYEHDFRERRGAGESA